MLNNQNNRAKNSPKQNTKRHQSRLKSSPNTTKGAERHQINKLDQSRSWFRNHIEVATQSYHRLWLKPLSTLLTLLVLAVALALPSSLLVGLNNLQSLSDLWQTEPKISLYLESNISDQAAKEFSKKLQIRNDIKQVRFISKAEGLKEFNQLASMNNIIDFLDKNPLPAVLVVEPKINKSAVIQGLKLQLERLPQVEEAVLDLQWIERLKATVDLANRILWSFGLLLFFAVLMVVSNSIHLMIENRYDEIIVARLMGATNAWVKRPFLYTGAWLGFLAGILAWLLVQISLLVVTDSIDTLTELYASKFQLEGLSATGTVSLIIIATAVGLAGAWLSTNRHLKEIEQSEQA